MPNCLEDCFKVLETIIRHMLMEALESGYYYFIYLTHRRQIFFFHMNVLKKKMDCSSLKSSLWIFWDQLKSLFKKIWTSKWWVGILNQRGNRNTVTWPDYILDKDPVREKREKWRQERQVSSHPEIKEWRREFSWERHGGFVVVVFKQKKDKLAF